MTANALGTLVGGIGLFLLGMSLMTDSLTALGGPALRRLLARLASRPWLSLLTGAMTTALLQSSSATTLVTVGFVSAGLLSFADSLALIFGANLGTTSTAWIVALIGLEVKVSAVALPLVGVGALTHLLSRGRRARLGLALSGFGLVFVGIDVMQTGMAQVNIDVGRFAGAGGLLSVLVLAVVGAGMTVIMQSSSAAVATTLVALNAGYLTLTQAAAIVVGSNVGTTITAILGAAGGRLAARRAALAHTLFNVGTGIVALALLGPFVAVVTSLGERAGSSSPEVAIAIFHTLFNALGVAIFFPFRMRFAAAVERLVPQRGVPTLEPPSAAVQRVPALALEATRKAAAATLREALLVVGRSLSPPAPDVETPPWRRILEQVSDPAAILTGDDEETRELIKRMRALRAAVDEIGQYLAQIRTGHSTADLRDEHVELVHGVDHLRRLIDALEDADVLELVRGDEELTRLAVAMAGALQPIADALEGDPPVTALSEQADVAKSAAAAARRRAEAHRIVTLSRLTDGHLTMSEVDAQLHAARWLAKFAKRTHRALLHFGWTAGLPHLSAADVEDA